MELSSLADANILKEEEEKSNNGKVFLIVRNVGYVDACHYTVGIK